MLNHREIEALLRDTDPNPSLLLEFKQSTTPIDVQLSAEMAALLGTPSRRMTPFLASVVDAVASKLEVANDRIKAGRVKVGKEIAAWLGDNQWSIIEKELYTLVVRDGVAYVLVTWTESGPRYFVRQQFDGTCGANIDLDMPDRGFNTWERDGSAYLDVFYPDRIEKYIKTDGDDAKWEQRWDVPGEEWPVPWADAQGNPLGIAIIPFALDGSQIEDALQIGRDLNEATLDMLATSRIQGWPQRWTKGLKNGNSLANQFGQPILNPISNLPIRSTIRPAPGSIIQLNENAELRQLDSSKPDRTVIDTLLELLAWITTVPTFYFGGGEMPSGVALLQAESRLNHKVEDIQARLSTPIIAMLRLTIRLSNYFARTTHPVDQAIEIPWETPAVITPDLQMELDDHLTKRVTTLKAGGLMSRETALREIHPDWSDEQIAAELDRLSTDDGQTPTIPVDSTPPTM